MVENHASKPKFLCRTVQESYATARYVRVLRTELKPKPTGPGSVGADLNWVISPMSRSMPQAVEVPGPATVLGWGMRWVGDRNN